MPEGRIKTTRALTACAAFDARSTSCFFATGEVCIVRTGAINQWCTNHSLASRVISQDSCVPLHLVIPPASVEHGLGNALGKIRADRGSSQLLPRSGKKGKSAVRAANPDLGSS